MLPVHVSALCCFHFPLHTIKVFYPLFLTPVRLLGIRGVAFHPTQSEKKKKDSHKKGKVKEVKELKVSHKIGQHDYDVRMKQARKFLEGGHRIKVPPPNDVAIPVVMPHIGQADNNTTQYPPRSFVLGTSAGRFVLGSDNFLRQTFSTTEGLKAFFKKIKVS